MTYKEAINRILTSVGENPIDSDPFDNLKNPTVSIILRSLQDTSTRLQASGYWFNTREVELTVNQLGQIILPEGTLNWRGDEDTSYQQGDKLVNSKTGSTIWKQGTKEKGRAIVLIDFELLPNSFAELITLEANLEAYRNTFGIDEHYQVLMGMYPLALDNVTTDVVRSGRFNTRRKRSWRVIESARWR